MTFNHSKIKTTHIYEHTSEVLKHGLFVSDFPKEVEAAEDLVFDKYGISVKYIGGGYSGCNFRFGTNQNPAMLEVAVTYFENTLKEKLKDKM